MKKSIIALTILIAIANQVSAQENDKPFRFGLKVSPGLNWYKEGSSDVNGTKSGLGFSYGLMADYFFAENYCISSGLEMFSLKAGYDFTNPASGIVPSYTSTIKTKYQYIQLPVSIKMRTKEIGAMRYFGRFGFNNAICYKATADVNSTFANIKNVDVKGSTNDFRFSLLIGGGAEYNIAGATNLIAGLYFDNSFISQNSSNGKIFGRGLVLDLAVVF